MEYTKLLVSYNHIALAWSRWIQSRIPAVCQLLLGTKCGTRPLVARPEPSQRGYATSRYILEFAEVESKAVGFHVGGASLGTSLEELGGSHWRSSHEAFERGILFLGKLCLVTLMQSKTT